MERDQTVLARWYPIRTWFQNDWLRFLPGEVRIRARHLLDSWLFYIRRPADAAVIHAFETYYVYAFLYWLLRRKTVIVYNPDGPIPGSPGGPGGWIRNLAVKRTALFVPWSTWTADKMKEQYPELSNDRICVLHPGIDLTRWPLRIQVPPSARFRLLFVGGDLMRKGADTLLDAFKRYLCDTCELHIVTHSGYLSSPMKSRIEGLSHVELHLDLAPASTELQGLFQGSDALVLPTNGDLSSWVALEALATGIPVIICPQGGIPDIVRDGKTGLLIPSKDPAALAQAVERLRTSPELRAKLIAQGRAHVKENFDAERNTERLLTAIKTLIG